jgi:hypothetical protein
VSKSLTVQQTELQNWVISKLDVEEYSLLLESAGSVGNLFCYLDNLVYRISKGYKPNKKELRVCHDLGLI